MSRIRLVLLLASALMVMLSVVVLRAETTRVNYEISQLDSRAENLRLELREKELELARFRDPAEVRKRLATHRIENAEGATREGSLPPPKPKPRRAISP